MKTQAAGLVEQVGEGVMDLVPSDRVLSGFVADGCSRHPHRGVGREGSSADPRRHVGRGRRQGHLHHGGGRRPPHGADHAADGRARPRGGDEHPFRRDRDRHLDELADPLREGAGGTIVGSANFPYDIPHLLRLHEQGQLDLDSTVARNYLLVEVDRGYADIPGGRNIRGVLVFE